MGEVNHADDAVDHRIADGDEAIDRPEGESVDHLLQEDSIHHARSHKKAAQHPVSHALVRHDRQVRKR
ncbi:hypothetical protein ALQ56_102899 [Pseudomonas syringae pv. papulans]|nr:hypothetical protein ALQ56_102899 [Pseudomonas syringae pv. papulans]